ncbi:hypothetical protein ACIQB5_48720 [Streptomyces sp. NPDC088560]|uniref:hypothetical protein n=1 Tax=Streptomyces sp. NPDC088560 TaxID=3365868 RepID=UPI0037FBD52B
MTDELQRLAEDLAADYLHGRWRPGVTEEHRARILSTHEATDGGLDGLAAGGLLAASSIGQMLRPHPMLDSWRPAPVLRAYPDGSRDAQALVGDLLDSDRRHRIPAAAAPPPSIRRGARTLRR